VRKSLRPSRLQPEIPPGIEAAGPGWPWGHALIKAKKRQMNDNFRRGPIHDVTKSPARVAAWPSFIAILPVTDEVQGMEWI
jgi:hypothetical protein